MARAPMAALLPMGLDAESGPGVLDMTGLDRAWL